MPSNLLENLISEAFSEPSSNKIYDIVENFPKYEKCQLQAVFFEKFVRIPLKMDSLALIFSFGKVLETLLFYRFFDLDSLSPNNLIDFLNCLLFVAKKLAGSQLSAVLLGYIEEYLQLLSRKDEVSEEERANIKEILDDPRYKRFFFSENFEESAEVEEIVFYAKSRHLEDKLCGTQKLLQLMTRCKGFREQIEVFCRKLPPILKNLVQNSYVFHKEEAKLKELLLELSKLVTSIIGEYEIFIAVDQAIFKEDSQENSLEKHRSSSVFFFADGEEEEQKTTKEIAGFSLENRNILHLQYKLANYEDQLRDYESIYSSAALIINTFLMYPHFLELQEVCFRVLSKLYALFPKFRKNLEEPLASVLTRLSESVFAEIHREVAVFLRKISADFLKTLLSKPQNKVFENFLSSRTNFVPEPANLANLLVKTVFPLEKIIEPGETFSSFFEVPRAGSLIYVGFATQQLDISVRVSRVCEFSRLKGPQLVSENVEIFKKSQVNAEKHACRLLFFARNAGLFQIEFDNSYSWVKKKCVRFKLLVFQPENQEIFEKKREFLLKEKDKGKENIAEIPKEKRRLFEGNSEDVQLFVGVNEKNMQFCLRNQRSESEWTASFFENSEIRGETLEKPLEIAKIHAKIAEFLQKQRVSEEFSAEKRIFSVFVVFNQDFLMNFLRTHHKLIKKSTSFKQQFEEILDLNTVLPEIFKEPTFRFLRDASLFLQTNFLEFQPKKREVLLLLAFSQGNAPFFQAFSAERRDFSSFLQRNAVFREDLTFALCDFEEKRSFKAKFLEICEDKREILKLFETFLYNFYSFYRENVKLVVFWQRGLNKDAENFLREEDLLPLKQDFFGKLRENQAFPKEIDEFLWVFEERALKNLNEF